MDIEAAVAYLLELSAGHIECEKDGFIPFSQKKGATVHAIDGSSVTLFDTHAFSICARRVGCLHADEQQVRHSEIGEITIDIISSDNADAVNDERRENEERALAETLQDGLILFDGCTRGDEHHVVGISKKSGMREGNVPLLSVLKPIGDSMMPKKCWYYEICNGIYAVKFHPYAPFVFRVDYHGDAPEEVFAEIAALCNDITCLGYPYPLAEIHRMVKIGREEAEACKMDMVRMLLAQGMSMDDLDQMLYDYHEYMEG